MWFNYGKKQSFSKTFLCLVLLIVLALPNGSLANDEVPRRVFDGRDSSAAIRNNLDYVDVTNSNTWAKDAIWETGALELMKGYGTKRFGLGDRLTVEQAIVLVYNMAGREAEAQLAAEALDLQRQMGDRRISAPRMWSDGYLHLAFQDGLITQQQYDDAFAADQLSLEQTAFQRNSSVTREEMAFFIAKVLEILPLNQQTYLFNGYRDWQEANPHRIPYVEAILQNKIMHGDNNGYFRPKGPVTREQAAQILQNAGPFIFQKQNMEKLRGSIEAIREHTDRTHGNLSVITVVHVRNSSGALHHFRFTQAALQGNPNELTGVKAPPTSKGVIVNDLGIVKDEKAFRIGQEIMYIVKNNQVLYASVLNHQKKTEFKLAKILSVDEQNRVIRSEILQDMPFADVRLMDPKSIYSIPFTGRDEAITVSEHAGISIDFVSKTLRDVKPESFMMLTIENGMITAMEKINLDLLQEEGIVGGILEENNPVLGYVTLYFPDGSGTSPDFSRNLSHYRTYSYSRLDNVSVFKNGRPALIEDLKPGDSVFLKLNENGNLIRISGTNNFYPVYGRVRTKGNGTLLLEKADGTFEQLSIPSGTPVFQERKRVSWQDIAEGDNIRILLQKSGNHVVIGEVTLQKERPQTSGIYRAQLSHYDSLNQNLVVSRMQQFKDGIWSPAQTSGFTKLTVSEQYKPQLPKGAQGTVYFATGKNRMGNDIVIRLALENQVLPSEVISDTIVEALPGRGTLALLNRSHPVSYDSMSLIVKAGKLLEPNQVKSQDSAYIVASNQVDGSQKANIIWLQEQAKDTGLTLIRGRISQINKYNSMTLESFSQFSSPQWEFMNVPRTLTLDPAVTRIFDDSGRIGLDGFDVKGENNFKNRTVYVLAQDGKAMLISTAPYGDVVYMGRIAKLEGLRKDSFGQVIELPSTLVITEAKNYNPQTWLWENKSDTSLEIPNTTVLMRNGTIITADQLEEGDRITLIQTVAGNSAYVIIAESY